MKFRRRMCGTWQFSGLIAMTVARLGCVAWMIHRDPGGPPADLVFIQAGQALAGLDEGGPGVRDQGGQRDRVRCGAVRCVAAIAGRFPGTGNRHVVEARLRCSTAGAG